MMRLIRFQFSLIRTGMTGWMLSMSWVRSSEPIPKLLLFCMGTLIRLATGFCTAFCSAFVLASAAGVSVVPDSNPGGPIGVSCAAKNACGNRRTTSIKSAEFDRKLLRKKYPFYFKSLEKIRHSTRESNWHRDRIGALQLPFRSSYFPNPFELTTHPD